MYAPDWTPAEGLDEPEIDEGFDFHPDALRVARDLTLFEVAGWDKRQIEAQDEDWLNEIQTARSIKLWAENRAQKKALDGVTSTDRKRRKKTFSRGEVAAYGASHGYDGWPIEAVLEVWQGADAILED